LHQNSIRMSQKKKLLKFAECRTFPHFFEPELHYSMNKDYELKSKWKEEFFKNNNPITLEIGCGKGEYSVELARQNPENNYIGIDIKGARMWRGAKDSLNMGLKNIAFVRTRVEFTPLCFAKNEIDEIWITFPDPQLGPKKRIRKRLTSSQFLTKYQSFLKDNGTVHLKTDDDTLYNYTKEVVALNKLEVLKDIGDLYNSDFYTGIMRVKTHYEKLWTEKDRTIKYLKFLLPADLQIIEPVVKDDK